MTTKEATFLINTLDSRHQSAQPLLRKLVAGEATVEDVDAFVETDSRYATVAPTLRALAAGEKVSQEDIDNQVDSKHEPIKPLLLALAAGLTPDAA